MSRVNKKYVRNVLRRKSKDNFYANMHSIIPALSLNSKPQTRKKKLQKIVKAYSKAMHHLIYHEETPQKEIEYSAFEPQNKDLKTTPNTSQDNQKQQLREAIITTVCEKTVRKQRNYRCKKMKQKEVNSVVNQLSISLFNSIQEYFS